MLVQCTCVTRSWNYSIRMLDTEPCGTLFLVIIKRKLCIECLSCFYIYKEWYFIVSLLAYLSRKTTIYLEAEMWIVFSSCERDKAYVYDRSLDRNCYGTNFSRLLVISSLSVYKGERRPETTCDATKPHLVVHCLKGRGTTAHLNLYRYNIIFYFSVDFLD